MGDWKNKALAAGWLPPDRSPTPKDTIKVDPVKWAKLKAALLAQDEFMQMGIERDEWLGIENADAAVVSAAREALLDEAKR